MKKLILSIITILFVLPVVVSAKEDLVKVYIFEAGGCPYCEAQIEYLKGLDSYNEKFKIVEKEAYVDHIDWEQGKDFELSKKVAEGFNRAGFEDATYQATPFVVISDVYAAASYSESLEEVIDKAYKVGDKDIVGCYEEGNTDCLDYLITEDTTIGSTSNKSTIITILVSAFVILATYLVKSTLDTKKIIECNNKKSVHKK